MRYLIPLLLLSHAVAAEPADPRPPLPGGAACVMAKWQGNTLDYALATGMDSPGEAQEAARARLAAQGYDDYGPGVDITHAQGVTGLPHAFVIVIRADFETRRGKARTSYGCGFSPRSYDDALWDAVRDLQRYSWGWVPDRDGYVVVERRRY